MKRFEFNKLIRNKLPERMKMEGVIIHSEQLSTEQYILRLKDKLIEEVREVLEADSREELAVELADVFEVIHALTRVHDMNFEEIEQQRLFPRELRNIENIPINHEKIILLY